MSEQTAPAVRVEPYSGDAAQWNAFVTAQPGATAFHRYEFAAVIAEEFGHRIERSCVRDADGTLVGALQLVHVRSALFGRFLVSMPFASYGGPLGEARAVRELAAAADARALAAGADLLELRSAAPLPLELPVSHRKVTMVLALSPGDPNSVFGRFKAKLRSQIRRPEKAGITVRAGADQVDAFFDVFSRHMRDLGTPTLPRSWFRALAAAFGDDFWVATAWKGDTPVACGAGFRWSDEFEITWASALREHNADSPNMAVYWALISRAAGAGLSRFNFGRCTPDSPTHRFKAQWGAQEEALYWYRGARSRVDSTPRPDSPKMQLATRVWQRLPLGVTNLLGPRVVRYIP